jgi:hypothetical protein
MNSLLNLVDEHENKKSMEYCSVSNCLTFQSGSDGNTVRLLNVSNIRIVKKQYTFFAILVPVVVCLILNQFYLFPFAKSSVVLCSAFLFFFKSKPTCTLLVNYHNVSFQEIPLKSSDMESAKRLIESFLNKKQKAYLQ